MSPETWAKREMHRAAGVAYVRRSADYRAVLAHGPSAVARPQTPDPTVRSGKRTWERSMQDWRKALTELVNVHNLTAPEDVDEDLRTAVRTALLELTPSSVSPWVATEDAIGTSASGHPRETTTPLTPPASSAACRKQHRRQEGGGRKEEGTLGPRHGNSVIVRARHGLRRALDPPQ